jgi:ligand-binding SRPBCC domain-containing protein
LRLLAVFFFFPSATTAADATFKIASPEDCFEGKSIQIGTNSSISQAVQVESSISYPLPAGVSNVYLEINYKCNAPFTVGLQGDLFQKDALIINPQSSWNKIYVALANAVSSTPVSDRYKVYFKILTPSPIEMKKGTLIDYKIKLNGISFKWKTEITEWDMPYKFADNQLKGPYTLWYHEHFFEEVNGKTIMKDRVSYLSKGWIFAPFLHWLFVDKKVKEIFEFRERELLKLFN